MDARMKAVFNWSGGKDSALALLTALRSEKYDVVSLLTTVSGADGRSTMHAIPERVLRHRPHPSHSALHGERNAGRGAGTRYACHAAGCRTVPVAGSHPFHLRRHLSARRPHLPRRASTALRYRGGGTALGTLAAGGHGSVPRFGTGGGHHHDLGRAIGQGVYRPQIEPRDGGGLPRRNRPLRRERRIPYALLRRTPLPAVRRLSAGRTLPLVAGGRHGGRFAPYLLLLDCDIA